MKIRGNEYESYAALKHIAEEKAKGQSQGLVLPPDFVTSYKVNLCKVIRSYKRMLCNLIWLQTQNSVTKEVVESALSK